MVIKMKYQTTIFGADLFSRMVAYKVLSVKIAAKINDVNTPK